MAKSAGEGLSNVINGFAKGIGILQANINKVLWGRGNQQPTATATYDAKAGAVQYQSTPPPPPSRPVRGNLIDSGLFNALDALNTVDLCNVVTYLADNSQLRIKKKKRPEKPWNAAQSSLYFLQDQAGAVVVAIDKYTAFPNTIIGRYAGIGPNAQSPEEAITGSATPNSINDLAGTAIKQFNIYNLLKDIQDTFSPTSTSERSLFSSQELQDLSLVPGLSGNLNIINDFIAKINTYADYRSIPISDLDKIERKIQTVRAVCVTIQNLDIQSAAAVVGNFLGVDIRSQIQKLNKYVDATKIIPTLRDINKSLRSFIKMAERLQTIIRSIQLIIRLAILLTKVFKFIIAFFIANPLPNLFTTSGIQTALDAGREAAQKQTDGITRLLKQINGLMDVILIFVRYILTNANELLIRLNILLQNLETCESFKDSDIIAELASTRDSLQALKEQLEVYITNYDSKNEAESVSFGNYTIVVVDEEVTDPSIPNKRRRGIALDKNGAIVVQSDLTFATDIQVIIQEVRLKLISAGLAPSQYQALTADQAAILIESSRFLDTEDVSLDDLTGPLTELDSPDNENENEGIGLNAFINKLKGGKRLRRRVRRAQAAEKAKLAKSLQAEDPRGSATSKTVTNLQASARQDLIAAEKIKISYLRDDILKLAAAGVTPTVAALILQKRSEIRAAERRIAELERGG